MPVVGVGDVRVLVRGRFVPVGVRVGLGDGPAVRVLVVLVVDVGVLVFERLVRVAVAVARAHQGEDAQGHQGACGEVARVERLVQQRDRGQRAHERRGGKERGLPGGAKRTLGAQVEDEAEPEAECAQEERGQKQWRAVHALACD